MAHAVEGGALAVFVCWGGVFGEAFECAEVLSGFVEEFEAGVGVALVHQLAGLLDRLADFGAADVFEEGGEGDAEVAGDLGQGDVGLKPGGEEAVQMAGTRVDWCGLKKVVHTPLPPRGRFCARAGVSSESEKRKTKSENGEKRLVLWGFGVGWGGEDCFLRAQRCPVRRKKAIGHRPKAIGRRGGAL